jgi:hypothetical protein
VTKDKAESNGGPWIKQAIENNNCFAVIFPSSSATGAVIPPADRIHITVDFTPRAVLPRFQIRLHRWEKLSNRPFIDSTLWDTFWRSHRRNQKYRIQVLRIVYARQMVRANHVG